MTDTSLQLVPTAPALPGLTPPSGATDRGLREVLVDLGFATQERVEAAVDAARAEGRSFERVLLQQGAISTEQLARALAERYGLAYLDLAEFAVDRAAVHVLDPAIARDHRAVPVAYLDDDTILVAVADPANMPALRDIELRTRLHARSAVASAEGIARVIDGHEPPAVHQPPALREPPRENVVELCEPAVEVAHALLADAAARRATAVHLEPTEDGLRARVRVDGSLVALRDVPAAALAAVKRLERGRYELGDLTVEVAVSVLPTAAGESAVVRLRDSDAPPPGLDELGLRPAELDQALATGRGVVLVAGASAAARAAAIEALQAAATTPARRVVVAGEDLGAARDADPDVLVVPAVRDGATATAALDAALDGVLVIAGLPAPDPERARLRLEGWGVEPFLVEHAIACVVGVRPSHPGLR